MNIISQKKVMGMRLLVVFFAGLLAIQGCKQVTGSELDETEDTPGTSIPNTPPPDLPSNLQTGTTPEIATERLKHYLSKDDFDALFPKRYGSDEWAKQNPGKQKVDYFSHANLLRAIEIMANFEVITETRRHEEGYFDYNSRQTLIRKDTGGKTIIYTGPSFNDQYINNLPIDITARLDFGSFLAQGDENDKRRELAAFLANISQETGRGEGADRLLGGLFYNEEIAYVGSSNTTDYSAGKWDDPELPHPDFPAVKGKSYHGRGPMQLSWNYNYGAASTVIFGNKDTLLNKPEMVTEDGIWGWATAIWFWMTPHDGKPSCHQIMTRTYSNGKITWNPSPTELLANRTNPGFGMTIMVINGGLEGNKTISDSRIANRVNLYGHFTKVFGATTTKEKLDTQGMVAEKKDEGTDKKVWYEKNL